MSDAPRPCHDCRFYAVQPSLFDGRASHLCYAREGVEVRDVDGQRQVFGAMIAIAARESYGPCGPEGRLFERKAPDAAA